MLLRGGGVLHNALIVPVLHPMKTRLLILVSALSLLSACAQHPVALDKSPAKAVAETPKAPEPASKDVASDAKKENKQPVETGPSALTGQVLYQFLLGEIAAQRGDLKLAADAYTDLAEKTRDVRVVRRAAEMAVYAHELDKAADMARLWVELEPKSVQARQLLVTVLVGLNRLDDAKPQLAAVLKMEDGSVGPAFLQIHSLLARNPNKPAVLALMKDLAAGYPNLTEAHLAVAQCAIDAGQNDEALTELDEALRLSPGSEVAALLKGQVLSARGSSAVLDYWKEFLVKQPDATRVRLAYARGLTKVGRFDEARNEFEVLLKKTPESPELHLAVALLSMQMNDLDAAEQHFSEALSLGYPDEGLIQMYLGQLNEARGRYDQALGWYRKVTSGNHAFQAGLKSAMMLGKLKRVDEALAELKKIEAGNDVDRMRIVQTEAQILSDAGRYQEAVTVLSQALEKTPTAGDLLYDRAMIEEKMDRLSEMEADLRQLIKLQPDAAHAYNALGYTLVDRTNRLDEGLALLEKALKLSPDDPFILDSMGWAQFKLGHLKEAVDYLRRAYGGRADPEIAAHLGEVLWQSGAQDEAKRIWAEARKAHPDNELLQKTLSRFGQ